MRLVCISGCVLGWCVFGVMLFGFSLVCVVGGVALLPLCWLFVVYMFVVGVCLMRCVLFAVLMVFADCLV